MALLSEAYKEKKFDTRIKERGLSKGQVTKEEINKHHQQLTDDAENADFTNLETLLESVTKKSGLR